MRLLGTRVLAVGVAVVLLVLGCMAAYTVQSMSRSTDEVEAAFTRVASFEALQRAISGEAVAEAGYRRAPSRDSRARLRDAVAEVDRTVIEIRAGADNRDGAFLSYLVTLNERYIDDVTRSLDAPPDTPVLDDRVAGPTLDRMQQLIDSAITGNNAAARQVVADQRRLVVRLALVIPGVVLIAALVLALSVRSAMVEQQRLRSRADDSEHRATHDPLTGLANRTLVQRWIQDSLAAGRTDLSVLMLDLDRFKAVNDGHGHLVGDQVLVAVGRRISAVVRPGDLVARLGGDEFVVLLPGCTAPEAVAGKILLAIRARLVLDDVVLQPGTSIGAVVTDRPGEDVSDVLRRADFALYEAKHSGRGRVVASTPTVTTAPAR